MEFWAVEVKSGEPFKFTPEVDMVLHLSQACLGEMKKQKPTDPVHLFVNIGGKKLVLGTLFAEKLPQTQFDLIFDKEVELSHNLKNGSVYFYGYIANNPYDDEFPEGDSDDSEEEELPIAGVPVLEPKQEKPVEAAKSNAAKGKQADAGKQKVKIVEPTKDVEESSDEDDLLEGDDDGSEDEDDSEDESESDEETPKKAVSNKKRPAESATKTPLQDKKAKVTPQKTDGKKVGGHVATPHPAKQAGKTPATNKPNQKSPKSGAHACKSCDRSFGSETGLNSHSKAKHGAAK